MRMVWFLSALADGLCAVVLWRLMAWRRRHRLPYEGVRAVMWIAAIKGAATVLVALWP